MNTTMAKGISPKEAAKRLGLSRRRVYAMIESGIIKAAWSEMFEAWVIPESEVDRILATPRPSGRPAKTKKEPPSEEGG